MGLNEIWLGVATTHNVAEVNQLIGLSSNALKVGGLEIRYRSSQDWIASYPHEFVGYYEILSTSQFSDARTALVFALGYLVKDHLGAVVLGWYHTGHTLFYFSEGRYWVSAHAIEEYPYLRRFPDEYQIAELPSVELKMRRS